MHAVARIYELVLCQVRMKGDISKMITSDIGVKQGCPLSPTLFGLCIDKLEYMVQEYVEQEGIEKVGIGNMVMMLLLYTDDVVLLAHTILLAHTLEDAQKRMMVLEAFCTQSGL